MYFKAPWRPFLSLMPHRPCITLQAEAMLENVLIIIEIELNSIVEPARPNNLNERVLRPTEKTNLSLFNIHSWYTFHFFSNRSSEQTHSCFGPKQQTGPSLCSAQVGVGWLNRQNQANYLVVFHNAIPRGNRVKLF